MKTINIVIATQKQPNSKQVQLINTLFNIFKFADVRLFYNEDYSLSCNINNSLASKAISMDGSLFDFSRYSQALSAISDSSSIVLMFNDTLGNGRKLNFPLTVFLILSIILVMLNVCNVSCPVDCDGDEQWISPYFMVSTHKFLMKYNWTNYHEALSKLTTSQIISCNNWINIGWRHSDIASEKQRQTKLKTLYLERYLFNSNPTSRLLGFSKKSPFRILNSIFTTS